MGLVFPAVVLAVVRPGAAAGAHEGAVQQDHRTAPTGDLLQGTIQTRGPGSEQAEGFQDPAAHGGGGDVVAAGHVEKPLVVTEHGEHDDRLGPRGDLAPAGAELFAPPAYQAGDEFDGPLRHGEPNLVDSIASALDGAVSLHMRTNSRRGPSRYGGNRPVRCLPRRSARQVAPRSGPLQPAPVGEFAQLTADRFDLARCEFPAQCHRDVLGHHGPSAPATISMIR